MIRKPTGTSLDRLKPGKKQDILPIEKDVPMPPIRQGASVMRETLLNMEVGDSFTVRHTASAHNHAKKLGMKICCRREDDGFRVWRIK